jgi:hypothetical protein
MLTQVRERPETKRLVHGLEQPLIALRLLRDHRDLLREALVPPFWLAVACVLLALLEAHSPAHFVKRFYLTFAAMAPLPSLGFSRHYARFAAKVHTRFGFGECKPRIEPLSIAIRRVVHGIIMVSIAGGLLVLPLVLLPGPLKFISAALTAVWALHWIVVDALDNAQVIIDGQTPPKSPPPWFVRMTRGFPRLSRLLDRYSKFWREEIEFIDRNRITAIGFGLATAALLATPVLNLFFRPITIAAGVHLTSSAPASNEQAAG